MMYGVRPAIKSSCVRFPAVSLPCNDSGQVVRIRISAVSSSARCRGRLGDCFCDGREMSRLLPKHNAETLCIGIWQKSPAICMKIRLIYIKWTLLADSVHSTINLLTYLLIDHYVICVADCRKYVNGRNFCTASLNMKMSSAAVPWFRLMANSIRRRYHWPQCCLQQYVLFAGTWREPVGLRAVDATTWRSSLSDGRSMYVRLHAGGPGIDKVLYGSSLFIEKTRMRAGCWGGPRVDDTRHQNKAATTGRQWSVTGTAAAHREPWKTCHQTCVHIFTRNWTIFKILLLAQSPENLQ